MPLALSMAVIVIGAQMRCTSWSMYEPSVDAKYFCSFTRNSIELTKLAPAPIAAALTSSSRSTFSLIGTSIAFLRIGVFQLTSPTPGALASCTGAVCTPALALAIAAACCAARATSAVLSALVAAKPQAPLTITRMPTPVDSVLTTFCTLSSRVITNCRR
ncbi:hypothetical protein D3C73_1032730 [compost metagenome]